MPILQATTSQIGQSGQVPKIVYIETNDTTAEVEAVGYLNGLVQKFFITLASTDLALVSTKLTPNASQSSVAFYDVQYSAGNWSLVASSSSGSVNAGLINEIAYYAAAGDAVSGLTTAVRGVLVTSNTGVPSILAGNAVTGQMFRSNAAAAPSWSTATWPATTTINQLLYSSAANTVAGLASANGGVLVTGATGIPAWLANPAETGRVLTSVNGDAPAWTATTFPAVGGAGTFIRSDGADWVASTLTVPNTLAINEMLYASSANVAAAIAAAQGGVLISSAANVPSWLANPAATGRWLSSVSADASVWSTATLPVTATGVGTILRADGTNWVASVPTYANTYAVSTLLYASSADVVTGLATANGAVLATNATGVPSLVALTDGQIIVGATAGAALAATISAGTGISVTNAANSITVALSGGGGLSWSNAGAGPIAAAINRGYVSDDAGATTFNLPAVFAIGDTIEIVGLGAGGWVLAPSAGDNIRYGSSNAATSLTSVNQYDTIKVVGLVANTQWTVVHSVSAGLTVV